ncbi:LysR family transcriptional regulator [Vibrio sinensis]|uniref:LysR family transcriptional regulator n=1 Tax=Vibrio sinensis TaxID=2302434 RepID=A0A3A6QJY3_9VIBR|nr:LysR family transcriptional regulator [Vibrio sinensis]RJX71485.1 LysR family transcriptional regulator [Vibrio sinensis]
MFNLNQLETLVLCVECGSFSAAARKLRKAQSAVSTAIANLEIDTGIQIFDRSSRFPVLTDQGEQLYQRAVALVDYSQSIENMIHAFSSGIEGKISIAINPILLTPSFYQMIGEFYSRFPDTELNLYSESNDNVAHSVVNHKADIGFMTFGNSLPKGIEVGMIGYLPFSVAVHHTHPLLNDSQLVFEQLKKHRQIILLDENSQYSTPLSPSITYVNSIESAIELLKLDSNWLLIPNHVINKYPEIRILKLPKEETDWLIQIDRITVKEKNIGVALEWLQRKSSECF